MWNRIAAGYVLALIAAAIAADFFGATGAFDFLMTLPVLAGVGALALLAWAFFISLLRR